VKVSSEVDLPRAALMACRERGNRPWSSRHEHRATLGQSSAVTSLSEARLLSRQAVARSSPRNMLPGRAKRKSRDLQAPMSFKLRCASGGRKTARRRKLGSRRRRHMGAKLERETRPISANLYPSALGVLLSQSKLREKATCTPKTALMNTALRESQIRQAALS